MIKVSDGKRTYPALQWHQPGDAPGVVTPKPNALPSQAGQYVVASMDAQKPVKSGDWVVQLGRYTWNVYSNTEFHDTFAVLEESYGEGTR